MRWQMPNPCVGSRLRTFRTSMSKVPWRRSGFSIGRIRFLLSKVDGRVAVLLSNVNWRTSKKDSVGAKGAQGVAGGRSSSTHGLTTATTGNGHPWLGSLLQHIGRGSLLAGPLRHCPPVAVTAV